MPKITVKRDLSPLTPIALRLARGLLPALPLWVTPNRVTVAGFALMVVAGLSFYLASFHRAWFVVAIVALLAHWIGDELDGELARTRRLGSELGFFLDIYLDAIGYVAVGLGLAFASYTQFPIVATYLTLILLRDMLIVHWILLRQTFVIPAPGAAEFHFIIALLAGLSAFAGPHLVTFAGYDLGWFDVASLLVGPLSFVEFWVSFFQLCQSLRELGDRPDTGA